MSSPGQGTFDFYVFDFFLIYIRNAAERLDYDNLQKPQKTDQMVPRMDQRCPT